MLSVGRGQDGRGRAGHGGSGSGFRGGATMEEENDELEEGEACVGDDDAFVDPDIALSYIDEKLQDVLGHFQKDFEGGVSAENLGSKFGGYGSFLPTYQRSPPALSQTRSSPGVANNSASRSPYHQPVEGACQNPSAVTGLSVTQNNSSTEVPLSDNLSKKESFMSTNSERDCVPRYDSLDSSVNGNDQKTLKVRIRVGSDNILARNNAAIYSGLGLDVSSPSSMEDSPDGHGGLSPEFGNIPGESPRTILQIMTCFSVPGGFLLSPLRGNILQLTKKVALLKNLKPHFIAENELDTCEDLPDPNFGDFKGHMSRRMKSDVKKKKSGDANNSKVIDDISAIMKREIDIETPAGQEIISDALNIQLLSNSRIMEAKAEGQLAEESMRTTRISNPSQENKSILLKEQICTDDFATVKAEAVEYIENDGIGSSQTDYTAPKGKLKFKTSRAEKTLEERNVTNHKNSPLDWKQESKVKAEKISNAVKVDSEGEGKNDQAVGPAGNVKNISSKETISYEFGGENVVQGEGNRMQKEQKVNAGPSFDFMKDDRGIQSSAAAKEKKGDSNGKTNQFEKKSKVKSHRELGDNLPKTYHGDNGGDTLENGGALAELHHKEKLMDRKNENGKEPAVPSEAIRDIMTDVKHDRQPVNEAQWAAVPSTCRVATGGAIPAPVAPVVIKEHWVLCDKCKKWRLLPYEMNPSSLPEKWQCSLLTWLPGMNRCDISEDETTKALNALYTIPVPAVGISSDVRHDIAAAGIATSSTPHINGQPEHSRKRKNALKDGNNLAACSYLAQVSVPAKRDQQASIKNRTSTDVKQYPFEKDSLDKAGLGPGGKSADFTLKKQKTKHKNLRRYSDGGDHMERSNKHSKIKSKRGIDQDECKASKKTKKEDQHHSGKDWSPGYDINATKVPDEAKILPGKPAAKSLDEPSDVSPLKGNFDSKRDLLAKSERVKDEDLAFSKGENKEHFHPSDTEALNLASRKRIMKEWEESQHNSVAQKSKGLALDNRSVAKEPYIKNENSKEKKSRVAESEGMASRVDSRLRKDQAADPLLSSNGGHLIDELDEDGKFCAGKECLSGQWRNLPSGQAVDLADSTKRDVGYVQTSVAATSSSSKVSGSQKSKANSHEARCSPIDSVSSSPMRISGSEKLSRTRNSRKDGASNVDSSTTGNPMRCLNTDVDMADDGSGKVRKERRITGESEMRGSLRGSSEYNKKEAVHLPGGHVSDGIHSERSIDEDLQQIPGKKDLTVKSSGVGRTYNYLHSADKRSLEADGPSMQPDHLRASASEIKYDPVMHESRKHAPPGQDKNDSAHFLSDGAHQSELVTGREKSQPRSDKQEIQKLGSKMACSPVKESKLEVNSTSVKSDAPKMAPQLRRPDIENGVQHNILRQATPNPSDNSSPIRKDGHSAAYALKEARDLKHKANRLKNEGQELESTGLYFEAALKFLHVASLLEPSSFDSLKQGDAAQSMKMYSDTAKLCEFCAHAYERCKKMAAAALAYKCVEVAYLKAAYYKHPGATKDRHELQAYLQMVPPGESPSSSASDIDNLNNLGLSKAASAKDANSPQVTGNHLIAARHHPHLLRLLTYTNDVNCAFDATRKSQIAITAAADTLEKGVDGALASVRRVLDFNFHNVNELLRLVRLSIESISR